jgi:type II secretory ATPase GspE/PulE/Tfp pilus assembly ATPase PilB-like protein
MGVEPFLVASTVEGVLAQRLVRRLCQHCKAPYRPNKDDLSEDFPLEQLDSQPLYRATGCRHCRGLGYHGRDGLFELLVADDNVRQPAHDRVSAWNIKQAATRTGMATLRDDGWRKVMAGVTSVDEVLRVTKSDRMHVTKSN